MLRYTISKMIFYLYKKISVRFPYRFCDMTNNIQTTR